MIRNIIDLLNMSDFYVGDPDIDFAKGKYKVPRTMDDAKNYIKRNKNGRK